MKKDRGNGFTLIELMVVISIISLFASIVYAGVTSVRIKAKNQTRYEQLNDIGTAIEIYNQDNGYYPIFPTNGNYISSSQTDYWNSFTTMLYPYIKTINPIFNEDYPRSDYYYQGFGNDSIEHIIYNPEQTVCIRFYPNSFHLYTYPLRFPTTESKNDDGVNNDEYEIIGGKYKKFSPCVVTNEY